LTDVWFGIEIPKEDTFTSTVTLIDKKNPDEEIHI